MRPGWGRWVKRIFILALVVILLYHGSIVLRIVWYQTHNPTATALMRQRDEEARARGQTPVRRHTWVPYERISPHLVRAVLAGEDSRFFEHQGFDWVEIQKAIDENIEAGEFRRGASTVTQQLAKNLFLSTAKTPLRKAHEALITWEMEHILSKRRILEIYLNVIEWGDGIYGAEAAARHYFNISAASLNPDQAAFLSAIIPSPRGKYNPTTNPRRVQRRKRIILRLMRGIVIPKDLSSLHQIHETANSVRT